MSEVQEFCSTVTKKVSRKTVFPQKKSLRKLKIMERTEEEYKRDVKRISGLILTMFKTVKKVFWMMNSPHLFNKQEKSSYGTRYSMCGIDDFVEKSKT